MLDLESFDLATLCHALEDHSPGTSWWLDPATGRLTWHETWADGQDAAPREAGLLEVEPTPSSQTRADMEEFVARVRDPGARERLQAALAERGGFVRFKEALPQVPELRRAWSTFHQVRVQRRAIGWLAEHRLIDETAAEAALAAHSEPPLPGMAAPPPVAGVGAAVTDAIVRAREEIHAARLLAGHGFSAQAVACAGAAARFAAAAALAAAGEQGSSADDAEQRFGVLVGSGHAFAPATGDLFAAVVARGRSASYSWAPVERADVEDAIRDASSVVEAAAAWVAARSAASRS